MTRATLSEVLRPALAEGYAVAGFVTLGWEDMRAYVQAAEEEDCPVILQVGPSCRAHTPLPVLAGMLGHLADRASVPVVMHLDHATNPADCLDALDCGFTSVMFDGSRLPLDENIETTAAVVEMAHDAGVSCEGEIGFVGYAEGEASAGTDPADAARFARETGVDAMAISVGNVHLKQDASGPLDEARIAAIQEGTGVPLVIHGGSGVPAEQRSRLARDTNICKFNIGTEMRMAFGTALRTAVNADPGRFDRLEILKETHAPMVEAAREVLRNLRPPPA